MLSGCISPKKWLCSFYLAVFDTLLTRGKFLSKSLSIRWRFFLRRSLFERPALRLRADDNWVRFLICSHPDILRAVTNRPRSLPSDPYNRFRNRIQSQSCDDFVGGVVTFGLSILTDASGSNNKPAFRIRYKVGGSTYELRRNSETWV